MKERKENMANLTKKDIEKRAETIKALEKDKKQIEEKISTLKKDLQDYMTDSGIEELDTVKFVISYKQIVQNRLDTKLLKEEKPKIYEGYLHEVPSSRFTVKEK